MKATHKVRKSKKVRLQMTQAEARLLWSIANWMTYDKFPDEFKREVAHGRDEVDCLLMDLYGHLASVVGEDI